MIEKRYQSAFFPSILNRLHGLADDGLPPVFLRQDDTSDMIDPRGTNRAHFAGVLDFIDLGDQQISIPIDGCNVASVLPLWDYRASLVTGRNPIIQLTFGAVSNIFSVISQTDRVDVESRYAFGGQ